jgi:outer membrane protein TolC
MANLAILRAAELDVEISRFEFKGFAEAFVAQVERAFWDLALAYERIRIVRASLKLAEDQREETEERIALGALAPTEGPAIQAQVAARKEDLINADSNLKIVRLRLIRLIKPTRMDLWKTPVVIDELPENPPMESLDAQTQVEIALDLRPDLNQARLNLRKNEFDIVRTRNGLLPRLDFFANLGTSGFAKSFTGGIGTIESDNFDVNIGLFFERSWGNQGARVAHRRSQLSLTQSKEALHNLIRLIEEEVQVALVEVQRTREQIAATRVTHRYAEEVLRSEREKFKIGRSTAILVSQAQRDLLASQIAETEATTNHWKAHINLELSKGSLLEARGIEIPSP